MIKILKFSQDHSFTLFIFPSYSHVFHRSNSFFLFSCFFHRSNF